MYGQNPGSETGKGGIIMWIFTHDDVLVNLDHIESMGINFRGEDHRQPWEIFFMMGDREYNLYFDTHGEVEVEFRNICNQIKIVEYAKETE